MQPKDQMIHINRWCICLEVQLELAEGRMSVAVLWANNFVLPADIRRSLAFRFRSSLGPLLGPRIGLLADH